MKRLLVGTMVALAALAWGETPVYKGPVKAEEVHVRTGVGNFMKKIADGRKEVTVAYLGGSITEMNGWRNMTTDWLRKTYPKVTFKEVPAAIGGTGSDLGVFRLAHDALRHNPDLLFVEFATNDSGASPESIWMTMEGIVRQTWRKDPQTDIVFTYTITCAMMDDYGKGMCPRAASAMEQLADFYGIPSIGFGPRIAAEVAAGRLAMTPDGRKEGDGKVLFAGDGVHPAPEGHAFYLKSIIEGFTQMKDLKPVDHAPLIARAPYVANNLEQAKMVPVEASMLTGSWQKLPADDWKVKAFGGWMGDIWYAGAPGDKLAFKFKGTMCRIYDLLGPDGGQVWVTVDGRRADRVQPRFDSYCTYHRRATLHVFMGAEGEHTVEIEVDKDQPSRQSVAFRLKDPEKELAEPKYQGTKFWPAQIMLVGDLVK